MCNRAYWSIKWPFYNESFSAIMSGRFELLMKFFHLNDTERQPDGTSDDYDNIRPLLDLVIKVFQSMYVPNQELFADENIIGYKDRLSWIQYPKKHKMKLSKHGH